jgi:cyclase
MRRVRVIPVILLYEGRVVKSYQFKNLKYIGDPINTVKIFNDLQVDELVILDIQCSRDNTNPNFKLIEQIAGECFMPVAYGGGIKSVQEAKTIFSLGIEKVILNSYAYYNPELIGEISSFAGNQSVIVSIDYKKNIFGKLNIYTNGGRKKQNKDFFKYVKEVEEKGAGECLLTCIDRDGTREGYDLSTIKKVSSLLKIPVIANGGANDLNDFYRAIKEGNASAVAAGSMFVFVKGRDSILINYPSQYILQKELFEKL